MGKDAYDIFNQLASAAKRVRATEQRIADLKAELEEERTELDLCKTDAAAIFSLNPGVEAVAIGDRTVAYWTGQTVEVIQGHSVFALKTPEPPAPSGDDIADEIIADVMGMDVEPATVDSLAAAVEALT